MEQDQEEEDEIKRQKRKVAKRNAELVTFREWIRREWGTCQDLRDNIDNEGESYFYESYTIVPVGRSLYYEFCSSSSSCYCKEKGSCNPEEEDDEEEEEEEKLTK